jgi:hypothetical protein
MAQHSKLVKPPHRPSEAAVALASWFAATGTTAISYAVRLDVRPETLSRWLAGRLFPSRVARLAIEYTTGGVVNHTAWADAPTRERGEG